MLRMPLLPLVFTWSVVVSLGWSVLIMPDQIQASPWQAEEQVQEGVRVQEQAGEAVEVEVEAGEIVMGMPFGFEPQKMLAAKRFQLTQVFQVEIELIERLCEPTPQQLAKLRIASKGAVKKISSQWWEKTGRQFGGMMRFDQEIEALEEEEGDEADQQAEEAEIEVAEIKNVGEIDPNMGQFLMMDNMGNPFKTKSPEQEAAWTNLVAGILNEEQAKTLSEFKNAQDQQRRGDLLDLVVGILARELSLTAQQRLKLHDLLQPHMENIQLVSVPFFEPYLCYYHVSKVTDEKLATILSPAQIQKMRLFLLPMQEIGAMMEMEADDD